MMTNNESVERDEQLESTEVEAVETTGTEAVEPAESSKVPNRSGSPKLTLRLTLSLLAITSVVALMLAGVNAVTKEPIAEYAAEKRAAAMAEVLPEAPWLDFAPVEITVGSSSSGATVTPMLNGYSSYHDPNGLPHALCVETYPSGYGGKISLMTGVSISAHEDGSYDLTVNAVRIVSHSETSGVGSKTTDPAFLDQYGGKRAGITVGSGENSIDAISGATVSSKAVTAGVNEAIDAAQTYVDRVLSGEITGVTSAVDGDIEAEGGEGA